MLMTTETLDERFGTIFTPSSMEELLCLCGGSIETPAPVRMWRGQADASWLLDSGAYRRLKADGGRADEWHVAHYETGLLDRATHRGYRAYEGRELSDFELLARLQHHGAATRLIDMTRSVLVALYFACATQPETDALLFGIHSHHLGGGEGTSLRTAYDKVLKGCEGLKHPQTWEPPTVSKRVAAQHSQFVYSQIVEDQPIGSLALSNHEDKLLVVGIPAALKAGYLLYLERTFDITTQALFPDIDGFGTVHSHLRGVYANERW